jgi:hypothetical protein
MARKGGGLEHFSDPEKQKVNPAHSEKAKHDTSSFKPFESTSKLKKENNTENKSPDTSESGETSIVKHDSTTDKFGREWIEKQWEIASGKLINELTQNSGDQTFEAERADRQNEITTLASPKESITEHRKFERHYRLPSDYTIRAKL